MRFPKRPRVRYQTNPLKLVLCQLRFPTILKINTGVPADYQDAIRGAFPIYAPRQDYGESIAFESEEGGPQGMIVPAMANHEFTSRDGLWRINLTSEFISFATVDYRDWNDFRSRLESPIRTFVDVYEPEPFIRIGLRYVNLIDRRDFGIAGTPWEELLNREVLGVVGSELLMQGAIDTAAQRVQLMLDDALGMILMTGYGHSEQGDETDADMTFTLDCDLFTFQNREPGKVPLSQLDEMHEIMGDFFRWATTTKLQEAMGPVQSENTLGEDRSNDVASSGSPS